MAGSLQEALKGGFRDAAVRYREFRRGFTPGQERLFQVFTFLARFTVLAAPLYLILGSGWGAEGLRTITAEMSASTLRLAGVDASSTGSMVSTGEMLVDVTRDSTGWKSITVFTALVVASRRGVNSKFRAIVAGTGLLLVLNLLRITSMIYAVEVYGVEYDLLHTFLWRWGLTAAVIVLWASWMRISTPAGVFSLSGD